MVINLFYCVASWKLFVITSGLPFYTICLSTLPLFTDNEPLSVFLGLFALSGLKIFFMPIDSADLIDASLFLYFDKILGSCFSFSAYWARCVFYKYSESLFVAFLLNFRSCWFIMFKSLAHFWMMSNCRIVWADGLVI